MVDGVIRFITRGAGKALSKAKGVTCLVSRLELGYSLFSTQDNQHPRPLCPYSHEEDEWIH